MTDPFLDDPASASCQRCHQPLLLDPSITSLTPAQHSLITSSLPPPSASSLPPGTKLSSLPPSSREGAGIWAAHHNLPFDATSPRSVAESFVLLSDSVFPSSHAGPSRLPPPPSNGQLSHHLHEILSRQTPVDHPLCVECASMLQAELQKQLDELSRERDAYIAFERGIARNREDLKSGKRRKSGTQSPEEGLGEYDLEGTDEEWKELLARKQALEKEEKELLRLLREKEGDLERVKEEERKADEEEEEMDRQERDFLLDHFERSAELTRQTNALKSAKTQLLLSQNLLRHLESTNVWNDAFHIGNTPLGAEGKPGAGITVGTINGLRLGGRPVVDWDEINAAWGLVALCVDRIAAKVGCVFEQYKIVPLGSTSRIEELPPSKNHYELFAASDLNILHNRRFSNGLVLLLDCIRQLIEYGRKLDRGWATGGPEIYKDRISGHSIRLPGLAGAIPTLPSMSIMGLGGSTSASGRSADGRDKSGRKDEGTAEEQWTRACRAVLWALKRILVVESEADRQDAMEAAPR